jgi:hypothetical protein
VLTAQHGATASFWVGDGFEYCSGEAVEFSVERRGVLRGTLVAYDGVYAEVALTERVRK